ncbi:MAG: MOSC domain-containing protein [Acidimicrobiales bacterium]
MFLTTDDLEAGVPHVEASPRDAGTLELIVRRPAVDQREVVERAELGVEDGLVGDGWAARGQPDPERQLTLMNWRAAALFSPDEERRSLAGDQLFVDLDLRGDNLPAGSRLAIGDAVVEVTPPPHRGCRNFSARFGGGALRLVNSPIGVALNLRGINARVVRGGSIARGDVIRRL